MNNDMPGKRSVEIVGSVVLVLNIVVIVLGVLYILAPTLLWVQHLLGAALLPAWLGNCLLVYRNHRLYVKLRAAPKQLRRLGYLYLLFSVPAFLCMMGTYLIISSAYADAVSEFLIYYSILYLCFFGLSVLGAILAGFTVCISCSGKLAPDPVKGREYSSLKKFLIVVLYIMLVFGIILLITLLGQGFRGFLEFVVSQYALYYAFIYLSITLLLVKLKNMNALTFPYYLVTGLGFLLTVGFLLPLLLTPLTISWAEREFEDAFGPGWQETINEEYREQMSQTRFSLPAYFLGKSYGDYTLSRDVLYYEGTEGIDEGLKLYYDAYLPPEEEPGLPGDRAVLIRIHGGAWTQGGKGRFNMMGMNKYFAAQGYAVFDVQYGLSTNPELGVYIPTPGHVLGSFTVDDMIRHLGIFTHHLADNAEIYNIDPERIFISGGSAGGQLATGVGLAMDSGKYPELFSPELKVIGLIPFYPGNKAFEMLEEVGGSEPWLNVESLVREGNPPVLIFQGTNDGLVPAETAASFKQRYLEHENENCAVLYMPLAGHAADTHFTGYYNKVFVYYMERFMAMVQHES